MNKQTQMYVGLGVVALAGYFLWEKHKKSKKVTTPAVPAKTSFTGESFTGAAFTGAAFSGDVGKVKKMAGLTGVEKNATVNDSSWTKGADGTGSKTFFSVQGSKGW